MYVCMCVCMYVCMYVCVCMYACMYVCTYVLCLYYVCVYYVCVLCVCVLSIFRADSSFYKKNYKFWYNIEGPCGSSERRIWRFPTLHLLLYMEDPLTLPTVVHGGSPHFTYCCTWRIPTLHPLLYKKRAPSGLSTTPKPLPITKAIVSNIRVTRIA